MRGKTWSHLDAIEEPVPKRKGGTRITEDDVRSIRAQYDAVFDPTIKRNLAARRVQEELSRKYGLTMANIYAIVKRKSWAHVE